LRNYTTKREREGWRKRGGKGQRGKEVREEEKRYKEYVTSIQC
jgi:hypothetical protein